MLSDSISIMENHNLTPTKTFTPCPSFLADSLTPELLGQCFKSNKMGKQPSVSQSTVLRLTNKEHYIAASCREREAGFHLVLSLKC